MRKCSLVLPTSGMRYFLPSCRESSSPSCRPLSSSESEGTKRVPKLIGDELTSLSMTDDESSVSDKTGPPLSRTPPDGMILTGGPSQGCFAAAVGGRCAAAATESLLVCSFRRSSSSASCSSGMRPMSSGVQCFSSKRRVCSSRSRRRSCKPGEMRVVWREGLGDVEGAAESSGRECEGEVVFAVAVDFGDLGETIGKREAEGEVGMTGVVVGFVGDCGVTDAV